MLLAVILLVLALVGLQVALTWTYPLKYEEHILASAKEFDVDPVLIAAVIKVESNYRPGVISPKGAVGLMQLVPETAKQVAGLLRMQGYSYEALSEPGVNIRLGSAYMRLLLTEFGEDRVMALAAYNGGLGRARDWWRQGILKPGGSASQIPFAETRNFVERVLKITSIYQALYGDRLKGPVRTPGG